MLNLILLLALTPSPASANYLTYVDDKGTKHVVQTEDEIPEQYRKKMKASSAGDPKNATKGSGAANGFEASASAVERGGNVGGGGGSSVSTASSTTGGGQRPNQYQNPNRMQQGAPVGQGGMPPVGGPGGGAGGGSGGGSPK